MNQNFCLCLLHAENVALGKNAAQSGTWDELVPDLAVDGQLGLRDGTNEGRCAHPFNEAGQAAWLYVDLGGLFRIFTVTVHNTYNIGGKLINMQWLQCPHAFLINLQPYSHVILYLLLITLQKLHMKHLRPVQGYDT